MGREGKGGRGGRQGRDLETRLVLCIHIPSFPGSLGMKP